MIGDVHKVGWDAEAPEDDKYHHCEDVFSRLVDFDVRACPWAIYPSLGIYGARTTDGRTDQQSSREQVS